MRICDNLCKYCLIHTHVELAKWSIPVSIGIVDAEDLGSLTTFQAFVLKQKHFIFIISDSTIAFSTGLDIYEHDEPAYPAKETFPDAKKQLTDLAVITDMKDISRAKAITNEVYEEAYK